MKIIFEDNKDTPSSILLSKSYYGDSIKFSGGARSLGKLIYQYIDSDDVLVFVDVSPDNVYTVRTYNSLNDEFEKYISSGRLFIIPIICIEYIILTALIRHKYLDTSNNLLLQKLVVSFEYSNIQVQSIIHEKLFSTTSEKSKPTLEKLYKAMLKAEAARYSCLQNKSIKNNQKASSGIFYTLDCKCDPKYCKLGTVSNQALTCESLESKAEKVFTSLPIIFADSSYLRYLTKLGIAFKKDTVSDILKDIKTHFGIICSELGMDNIME